MFSTTIVNVSQLLRNETSTIIRCVHTNLVGVSSLVSENLQLRPLGTWFTRPDVFENFLLYAVEYAAVRIAPKTAESYVSHTYL